MKRFKKLTIYVLVGVLLSSSVMMSYKKAEVVQASATLTLGTGALLMLGILGAYGIVYKGAVDSATGEYIWKGDRGAYPHEVEEAEEWFSRMYDNAVRNWCAQNGKDPDDWNGDDDGDGDDMDEIIEQPPLWNTLVGSSVATNQEMMKRAIKITGALAIVLTDVVNDFRKITGFNENKTRDVYTNVDYDLSSFGINANVEFSRGRYLYEYSHYLLTSSYNSWYNNIVFTFDKTSYTGFCVNRSNNKVLIYNKNGTPYICALDNSDSITNLYISEEQKPSGYSLLNNANNNAGAWPLSNFNKICFAPTTLVYVKDSNSDEIVMLSDNEIYDKNNYGLSTNVDYSNTTDTTTPILPTFYYPNNLSIEVLLNNLESTIGDETGTQNTVDTFVDSLGESQTEPDTGGDTVPDTGGNEGTGTNPDTGGQGGTGGDNESNEDEENGMFLADLKNVFPFCIPFDLVDCFRLFNAEPETPRVEVPLHFGIVEKDYTFVIDLKDFDGVAEICRSMFLILYIVGLVMATRPLIRG